MAEISKNIIKKFNKIKNNRVFNLQEMESAKKHFEEIDSKIEGILANANKDPSHKIYTIIQNWLSYFAEEIYHLDELNEYYDVMIEVEGVYIPSYPPQSPLTSSYFTFWAFFDLKFGKNNESIGTIFKDLLLEYSYDELIVNTLTNLNTSCMRFYKHIGFDGNLIILKDILTEEKFYCISTSGYKGKKNQIWYVRIVANLDQIHNYHLVLTTPYIVINYTEIDWLKFFKRQGIIKGSLDCEEKYIQFMKSHDDNEYWHNYIMDAYSNYTGNSILLTGIPDIKGSKPHELNF